MGSKSDLAVMQDAADVLKELGVEYEITVVSAHRTPDRMFSYARAAADRGLKGDYCRCRRRSAFAGYGGFINASAGNWRSGEIK